MARAMPISSSWELPPTRPTAPNVPARMMPADVTVVPVAPTARVTEVRVPWASVPWTSVSSRIRLMTRML